MVEKALRTFEIPIEKDISRLDQAEMRNDRRIYET